MRVGVAGAGATVGQIIGYAWTGSRWRADFGRKGYASVTDEMAGTLQRINRDDPFRQARRVYKKAYIDCVDSWRVCVTTDTPVPDSFPLAVRQPKPVW